MHKPYFKHNLAPIYGSVILKIRLNKNHIVTEAVTETISEINKERIKGAYRIRAPFPTVFPPYPLITSNPVYRRLYKKRNIILAAKKPVTPIQIIYRARRSNVPHNLTLSPPSAKKGFLPKEIKGRFSF
jgi:hypothetical protein